MVICNFCLLAGIDPAAVNAWFLAFYVDAYEWVVAPNVIGMGLNADGGQIATKPYIASANYINKMSDYCAGCRFNPKQRTGDDACPVQLSLLEFPAGARGDPARQPAFRTGGAGTQAPIAGGTQCRQRPGGELPGQSRRVQSAAKNRPRMRRIGRINADE